MKRLKYSCPFGGKRFPVIAVSVTLLICLFIALKTSVHGAGLFFVMFCIPLLAAAVCFFLEHRLTAEERILCESAELPLWEPVTPEQSVRIREHAAKNSISVVKAALISLGFGAFLMFYVTAAAKASVRSEEGSSSPAVFAFVGAVVMLGALLFYKMKRETWADIDDTAVCTRIPIHHIYDVHHSAAGFSRTEWDECYLVCYQPDGRYTLHSRQRSGDADSVLVVKYAGMICWLPEKKQQAEPVPEAPEESAEPLQEVPAEETAEAAQEPQKEA